MKNPRIPIFARILGLNALLVFMPVASFLSLDTYEKSLLSALEDSLVQQGRVLAAWLGDGELGPGRAAYVLGALERRHTARLRVLDSSGVLLADTSLGDAPDAHPDRVATPYLREAEPAGEAGKPAEASWIYRLLSAPVRAWRRYLAPPAEALASADFYTGGRNFLEGSEIRAALEGRYGAATRISAGGQVSVTLYSALPVRDPSGAVRGAVLASQSTYRILASIYGLRLEAGKIFLASLAVASALSFLFWLTISRPLRRLGSQARSALSLRGLSEGHFEPGRVSDEIGDLAGALREFSSRLGERLSWSESFAADLAHEIRNPLASIRAAAELLEGADTRETAELAARIEGDVERANRVVEGLRELSRIESEEAGEEAADVPECARGCAERAQASETARSRGVLVRTIIEPDGEALRAAVDPGRLAIALGALLDNAVSFSPEGGGVEIRIARTDGDSGLCVSVLDRGPGIPPEHLELVFRRFFTFRPGPPPSGIESPPGSGLLPPPRRADGHCGLGLAIARGIAIRAGGSIRAANRPGGGARFTLDLPRAPG